MSEQNYFKLTFGVAAFLVLAAASSFIILIVSFTNGSEDVNNNIFEMIYMTFHLLVTALITVFALRAIKAQKSLILENLMYNSYHRKSLPARIIAISLSAIGLGFLIYESLVLSQIGVAHFSFPLGLRLDILNAAITLLLMGLIFFFYPMVKGEINKK